MSSRGNSSPGEQTPFSHSGFHGRQVDVEESAQNMHENTVKSRQSVNAGRQRFSSVPTQSTGDRNNSGFSEFVEAEVSISPVTQNGNQHISRFVGGSTQARSTTETNRAQFVNEKPCDFQQNCHQFQFANELVRRTQVLQVKSAMQTYQFVQAELPSLSSASEKLNHRQVSQNIHQNNRHLAPNVVPFLQETVAQNEPQNWFAAKIKQNVRHENVVKIFKTWSMEQENSQFVDVESVSSPAVSEENYDNSQFVDEESLGSPFGSVENGDDTKFFDEETLDAATALIKDAVKKITEYLTKPKSTSEQNLGDTFSQNNDFSTQSLPTMQENATQTSHFVQVEEMPIEQTSENGHLKHQVLVETSPFIKTEAEEVSIELSNKFAQTETNFIKVEEMPIEPSAENGLQNHIQFVNKSKKSSQQEGMETSSDETDIEDETIELSNTLIQTETNQVQEFTSTEHKFEMQNSKVLNQSLPIMQENTTQTSHFVKIEEMSIEPSAENGLQNHIQFVNTSEKESQQEGTETPFEEADTEDDTIELSNTLIQTETNQVQNQGFTSNGQNDGNVFVENDILYQELQIKQDNTTQTSHFVKVEEMSIELENENYSELNKVQVEPPEFVRAEAENVSIEHLNRFVQTETNQIQNVASSEHKFEMAFSQNSKVFNQSLPIMQENTTQTSHFVKVEEMSIEPSAENGHQNYLLIVNKSEEESQQEASFDETNTEDETIELSNTLIQTTTNQVQEFTITEESVGNEFSENNGILNQSLPIVQENTTQTSHFVKIEEMSIEPSAENGLQNHIQFVNKSEKESQQEGMETSTFDETDTEDETIELSNTLIQTATNQAQEFTSNGQNDGNVFLENDILYQVLQIKQDNTTQTSHFVKVEEMSIELENENYSELNKVQVEPPEFVRAEAENVSIEHLNRFVQTETNQIQNVASSEHKFEMAFSQNSKVLNQSLPIMQENTTQTSHFVKVEEMSIEPSAENGHQNYLLIVNKSEKESQQEGMETSPFDEADTEDETIELSNTLIQTATNQVQEFRNTEESVGNEFSENNGILNQSLPIMKENTTQTSQFIKIEEMPIELSAENGLQNDVQFVNTSEKESQQEGMETQFDETDTEDDTIELSNTLIQTETNQVQEFTSTGQNDGNVFLENNGISNQSLPIMQENTTQTSHFVKVEEMSIEPSAENGLQNDVQIVNTSEKQSQQERMESSPLDETDTEDETIELSNTLIQTETNQIQEFTSNGQNVGNFFLENKMFNQSFPIKQDNTTQTSHLFKVEEMPIELEAENYSSFNKVQVETSQSENVSIELSNRFVQTETNQEQDFGNMFSQNNEILNQALQINRDKTQTSNFVEVEETPLEPNIEIGHFSVCVTTDNNKIQEIQNVPQRNQELTSSQQNPQNNKRKSQESSNPTRPSNNPEIVCKAARIVKENATENCTFVNNECLESRKDVDEVNNDVTVCNSPTVTNKDGFAGHSNNLNFTQTAQTHTSSNQSSKSPDVSEHSHKEGSFWVTHHGTFNSIQVKHYLDFDFSSDVADFAKYYAKIVNTLAGATRKSLVYAKRGDKIQLELRNPELKNTVSVILRDENDLSCVSALLDRLGEANAKANASVNQLEMVVQIVQVRAGGGKRKCEELEDLTEKKRKYLYVIRNHDNQLCFAISLAYVLHPGSNDSEATRLGAELQRKAGLTDQTPVTFGDVAKFEQLTNRKIIVFYREENAKTLNTFMTSFERTETPPVYLYLQHNHYVGIRNIQAFVGKNFCEHCFQTYNSSKTHFCAKHCPICLDPGCETKESKHVICQDCYHKCRSNYCYEAHKKPRWHPNAKVNASECDRSRRCRLCKCTYFVPLANIAKNQPSEHKCPVKVCAACGDKMDKREHKCYVLPLESVKNNSETNLIFYEFKSYVTDVGKHVPFVLSAKTLRGKTWTAYGERCIVEFLLHFKSKVFNGTTFISHCANSSILLANMTEIGENTNVITQSGKIVCIELPDRKQKFVDAASFLPMPLAALPETFGFSTYKGFFPVSFISKENLQYVGKCPAPEFYAIELMNDKKRQDFEEAYQLASIGEFNFKREAQIYCEDDVDILTTACVKLRTFFINRYNVDPFSCASLKAFGMRVFCAKFLTPATLAIPPFDDYKPNKKMYTDASIEWLEWVMFSEKIFIQHALNKGVKQLKKCVYVDGYSEANGQKVAWEFVSCSQNFCPVCFPSTDQGERHRISEEKLEKLANVRNVRLIVMREHNWNKMKQSNVKIEEFLKHYEKPQPLMLQELANGNLNGVVKLRHSAGPDEEIRFAQVNLLFAYVAANQPYPIGHPGRVFENFGDLQSYFGLIKAVVYPPRALFLPFLPFKTANGKTVFTLCRTCDDLNNQQGACVHNDDERALTGVWVTPEFDKALQLGYKVGKIIEVWHFEQKSNRIFEEFVNNFVKGKKESSVFYSKPAYLAKAHIYEGCLDEFWKGFGDRNPQIKTEIVSKNSDLVKLMFSDEFKVEYFKILSIKTALVQWTQDKSLPEKTDNVFITAFTAAYARLHLYDILEKLQEKVLYFDEDQVIYVAKHGQNELEFGYGLGQLTDKLAGQSIQEFASTGLKSYAFQTTTNRVVMNVKGITQTLEKCEKMNLSVKDVVKGFCSNCDESDRESIKLDLKSVYDQRRLLQNGNTLPFGY